MSERSGWRASSIPQAVRCLSLLGVLRTLLLRLQRAVLATNIQQAVQAEQRPPSHVRQVTFAKSEATSTSWSSCHPPPQQGYHHTPRFLNLPVAVHVLNIPQSSLPSPPPTLSPRLPPPPAPPFHLSTPPPHRSHLLLLQATTFLRFISEPSPFADDLAVQPFLKTHTPRMTSQLLATRTRPYQNWALQLVSRASRFLRAPGIRR